jgi:hypothetical protein
MPGRTPPTDTVPVALSPWLEPHILMKAMEKLDDILSVDGFDALYIDPSDLLLC